MNISNETPQSDNIRNGTIPVRILLVRHGKTTGNLHRRYIGITDEPLCEEGIRQLEEIRDSGEKRLQANGDSPVLFCSPMIRCRQTAEILFPGMEPVIIPELAEMNFGIFENRSYEEDLKDSPEYLDWLDSRCEGRIPGGESKDAFTARCSAGFMKAMQIVADRFQADTDPCAREPGISPAADGHAVVFVVHGGTIMSVMQRYARPAREYYEWNPANGHGFEGIWDGTSITDVREL